MGPSEEHVRGIQSSKPMRNPHWLLNYPFTGFSMASSHALNSPNVKFDIFMYIFWNLTLSYKYVGLEKPIIAVMVSKDGFEIQH